MNCAEFREAIWAGLDREQAPAGTHAAECPHCRAYAAKAQRLHDRLPSAFAEAQAPDMAPGVLAALRAERKRQDIPAAAVAAAAAAAAAVLFYSSPYLGALPDLLAPAGSLLSAWSFFTARSGEVSVSVALPTLALAAALWLSTLHRIRRGES